MNGLTVKKTNKEFNHNTSWQYEEVGELYDAQRFQSATGQRFHLLETNAIQQLLDIGEKRAPIRTAIDLPCGTGRISQIPAERGYDLLCADISVPMLKASRKKIDALGKYASYAATDIYNLPFSDGTFDCASCIRLFQHLNETECLRALTELNRISSHFVIANFMYASGYYQVTRYLRQKAGRYAPRYTIKKSFLDSIEDSTGLKLIAQKLPQPLHSGNLVVLFKSSNSRQKNV
jgi:ubiquinone/menaquinone biosynthesis C-methylase UbiE